MLEVSIFYFLMFFYFFLIKNNEIVGIWISYEPKIGDLISNNGLINSIGETSEIIEPNTTMLITKVLKNGDIRVFNDEWRHKFWIGNHDVKNLTLLERTSYEPQVGDMVHSIVPFETKSNDGNRFFISFNRPHQNTNEMSSEFFAKNTSCYRMPLKWYKFLSIRHLLRLKCCFSVFF